MLPLNDCCRGAQILASVRHIPFIKPFVEKGFYEAKHKYHMRDVCEVQPCVATGIWGLATKNTFPSTGWHV